jgi:TIR domain
MSKDVFISYSSGDKVIADDICDSLERCGVACWVAPRDIPPGAAFDEAILDAIEETSAFVLILSAGANVSPFVKNEVNRAFAKGKAIFTLEFYLASHHWTDGFPPPLGEKVDRMAAAILALLDKDATPQSKPAPNPKSVESRLVVARELVTSGTFTNIDFGEDRFGSITSKEQRDTYTFKANAGDVIVIRVVDRNASGGRPVYWVPHIELRSETRRITESSGPIHTRLGPEILLADGTFSIIVGHAINQNDHLHTGTGDYVLFLQRVNNPGRAKRLDRGDELMGILNHGGQVHTYAFDSVGECEAMITMTREEKGGIFPLVELYDMKGRAIDIVHSYSPAGQVGPAIIKRPLSLGGAYTILASSFLGTELGVYRIGLQIINLPPTEIPTSGEAKILPVAAVGSIVTASGDLSAPGTYLAEIVFENGEIIRDAELSCGPRGWSSYVASIEYTKDLEVIRASEYGPNSGRFIGFDKISRLEFLEMDDEMRQVIEQNRTYRSWIRSIKLIFNDGTVWDKIYLLDHCHFRTDYESGNLEGMRPKTITIKSKN